MLSRGVFATEGDGLQLVSSAGQGSEARLSGFKSLLQEAHCQAGVGLHGLEMSRTASLGRTWTQSAPKVVLTFSQAVQLGND